jgi:hypothetical protein
MFVDKGVVMEMEIVNDLGEKNFISESSECISNPISIETFKNAFPKIQEAELYQFL